MCRYTALFALVAASLLTFSEATNKVVGGAANNNNISGVADDSTRPKLAALGGDAHAFEVANDMFLLDGEPFRIISGE